MKTKSVNLVVAPQESQGIIKLSKIHHLGTMNVCIKFHGNPSDRC